MQEMRFRSLGRADPLEEEMVTRFSMLAWEISWTEELGGLQFMGLQRVGQTKHTHTEPSTWPAEEKANSCPLSNINWIFLSEDENCKGKVMGRISRLLGQVDRNSTWQSLFFLTFCPKVTSLPLVCYLIDVWSFWVHVSSGYEPAWSTLFRSPLEQQLMETCFPFLQISLEPRGPRDWETGRKKEGREFGFCIFFGQPSGSHSASLAVVFLYDGGNYIYQFDKCFDILK